MASPSSALPKASAPASGDDGLPPRAALSLALAAPPQVTSVALRRSGYPVEPDTSCRHTCPGLLAADPTVLLLTPSSLSERDEGELRTRRDAIGINHVHTPLYILCSMSSTTASPVPNPDEAIFRNDLGVPGGGGRFMIPNIVRGRDFNFLCFSSESGDGEWVAKEVANPLARWVRSC